MDDSGSRYNRTIYEGIGSTAFTCFGGAVQLALVAGCDGSDTITTTIDQIRR